MKEFLRRIGVIVLACTALSACELPGSVAPKTASPVNVTEPSAGPPPDVPNGPTGAIEQKYYADGPWAVTSQVGFACCDSTGNKLDVWYPTDLGKDGFLHPVISWGDGTVADPQQYAYLLRHFASWGFIVIASETDTAHTGQEIIDAAQYIVDANSDPASPFYGKVAVGRIGAAGHSQGAAGALLAMIHSNGLISTVIPFERPQQKECTTDGDCPSTSTIANGSIFFVNGSKDGLSPSTQKDDCIKNGQPNEQSNACFYQMTPDNIPKAWGTLIGPNHDDVQGEPDCSSQSIGSQLLFCTSGVYGFLGYPTAWMMAQLQDDAIARSAFTAGGEFFQESANWENQNANLR